LGGFYGGKQPTARRERRRDEGSREAGHMAIAGARVRAYAHGVDGRFDDRRDGGRALARAVAGLGLPADTLVLGLARGGVPVAYEVAIALGFELDVLLVRKLGVPGHPELAMGAIASGGIRVLNEDIIEELRIPAGAVERVAAEEGEELRRRETAYRDHRPAAAVAGRSVVLVDDGLATGASMRAAIAVARAAGAARVMVAAPVAAGETCAEIEEDFAGVGCVCVATPNPFYAVGPWYREFAATADEEVRDLLARAAERQGLRPGA